MKTETTVLIVDDHPLLRRGLRDVLAETPRYRIVGEASDGDEALRLLVPIKPEILILDAGSRRSERVRSLLLIKPQLESLTPAERRILKLIGEDYTSKEIADRLRLSVRTVDNHRQHICNKLKLHGTHSLLKFAFDN